MFLISYFFICWIDFKNVSIVGHYVKDRTKDAQFVIIRYIWRGHISSFLHAWVVSNFLFCATMQPQKQHVWAGWSTCWDLQNWQLHQKYHHQPGKFCGVRKGCLRLLLYLLNLSMLFTLMSHLPSLGQGRTALWACKFELCIYWPTCCFKLLVLPFFKAC